MTQCKYCKHYELDKMYCQLRKYHIALDTLNDECKNYERISDEYIKKRAVDSIIKDEKLSDEFYSTLESLMLLLNCSYNSQYYLEFSEQMVMRELGKLHYLYIRDMESDGDNAR